MVETFVSGGCMGTMVGAGRAGVDVGVGAGLELVGGLCYLGDVFGVGLMMRLWGPEFEFDGMNLGS